MVTRVTPSISEVVESYLEERELDLAPESYRTEKNLLARFVRWCPDKQMGRLTAQDCEGFMRALQRGDKKAGCRKPAGYENLAHARTRLSQLVAWSHRKGYCKGDLMHNVKKPQPDVRKDFLQLTPEELMRALDLTTHPRDRAFLSAAMNTGLRSSELCAIRLRDVDLDNAEIYTVIFKGKVSDNIPITEDFDVELRRWLTYYESECGPFTHRTGEYLLFPAKSPDRFLPGSYAPGESRPIISGKLKPNASISRPQDIALRALLSLGYSKRQLVHEGVHTFRRSVARIYFDLAADDGYSNALEETARLLHHKSMRTTELYIGTNAGKARVEKRLKGKPFISAMVSRNEDAATVTPLHSEGVSNG